MSAANWYSSGVDGREGMRTLEPVGVGERGGEGKEKEPRPEWEKSKDPLLWVDEKDVAVEGRENFQMMSPTEDEEEVLELGEWSCEL